MNMTFGYLVKSDGLEVGENYLYGVFEVSWTIPNPPTPALTVSMKYVFVFASFFVWGLLGMIFCEVFHWQRIKTA